MGEGLGVRVREVAIGDFNPSQFCRDVPPERLYDWKQKGGYKTIAT